MVAGYWRSNGTQREHNGMKGLRERKSEPESRIVRGSCQSLSALLLPSKRHKGSSPKTAYLALSGEKSDGTAIEELRAHRLHLLAHALSLPFLRLCFFPTPYYYIYAIIRSGRNVDKKRVFTQVNGSSVKIQVAADCSWTGTHDMCRPCGKWAPIQTTMPVTPQREEQASKQSGAKEHKTTSRI
ncbi:hypothetical protein Fcan01_07983 [Folsomia candida]|uniref:Uncharacterized protein n=1 Tax=Folsomia candida TaxID=158441 RepID=A0A226EJX0_FOLCA|nr:hypothetical protein Fcan01_07983 [Folsomia candida]